MESKRGAAAGAGGAAARNDVLAELGKALAREAALRELLLYRLIFANHPKVFERRTAGRRRSPKGSYWVTEDFLPSAAP